MNKMIVKFVVVAGVAFGGLAGPARAASDAHAAGGCAGAHLVWAAAQKSATDPAYINSRIISLNQVQALDNTYRGIGNYDSARVQAINVITKTLREKGARAAGQDIADIGGYCAQVGVNNIQVQ